MPARASTCCRRSHLFIFVLVVIALAAITAGAQDSSHKNKDPKYGVLFGTVWDTQGRPVYGVTVYIRPADKKKARWTLVSDHNGEFAQHVPAGDYVIWTEQKQKHQKRVQSIETKQHVELNERIDFGLHLSE